MWATGCVPLYEVYGRAATYTPLTGSTVACTVLLGEGAIPVTIAGVSYVLDEDTEDLFVRSSEVATPIKEETFTVGSDVWKVVADPKLENAFEWHCRVKKASIDSVRVG